MARRKSVEAVASATPISDKENEIVDGIATMSEVDDGSKTDDNETTEPGGGQGGGEESEETKPPTEDGDDDEEEVPANIPEIADKLLQVWPDYESLYIDDQGGVYDSDTQPNIRGEAILYKNKYYNK